MSFVLFRAPQGPETPEAANSPSPRAGDVRAPVPELSGLVSTSRFATDFGPVPAALLRRNDWVQTVDGGFLQVRSIRMIAFEAEALSANPELGAVVIRAGALGGGLPGEDLAVAPGQILQGRASSIVAGACSAGALVGRPGITRAPARETAYYQPVLDAPVELVAEGARLRF